MADVTPITIPGIGPVKPIYVYGVAGAAAGYILWRYWQAGSGEAVSEVTDDESVIGDEYAVGTYVPPTTQNASIGLDETEDLPGPTTNAQWTQEAVELLAGYDVNPAAAALALGLYLRQQPLSPAQVDIVTQALALLGPPPQSGNITIHPATGTTTTKPKTTTPYTPVNKKKVTSPTKKKAATKYVTVRRGDTLSEIARDNKTTVTALKRFSANRYIFRRDAQGDKIYPGDRVRVK